MKRREIEPDGRPDVSAVFVRDPESVGFGYIATIISIGAVGVLAAVCVAVLAVVA